MTTSPDGRLEILVDVPIRFDTADGTVVHSPMVHAVVGRITTRLILDTGSTDHVLTKELIDRVGATTTAGEDGIDHAGAAVPSWTVGDLGIGIDGRAFALRDVIAIAGPAPFEGWGVGGFLSPQHLHPSARVLIDLVGERLVIVGHRPDDELAAIDAELARRCPGLRAVQLPRAPDTTVIATAASVEDGPIVTTMLNTGGRGTEFARAAAPALEGVPLEDHGHGLSGAPVTGSRAGARTVHVADVVVPVAQLVLREEMDGPQGILGMDVLRGTALIFGADPNLPITWLVPPTWERA